MTRIESRPNYFFLSFFGACPLSQRAQTDTFSVDAERKATSAQSAYRAAEILKTASSIPDARFSGFPYRMCPIAVTREPKVGPTVGQKKRDSNRVPPKVGPKVGPKEHDPNRVPPKVGPKVVQKERDSNRVPPKVSPKVDPDERDSNRVPPKVAQKWGAKSFALYPGG